MTKLTNIKPKINMFNEYTDFLVMIIALFQYLSIGNKLLKDNLPKFERNRAILTGINEG